jgi:Holliday junction DNA helicase RuvA
MITSITGKVARTGPDTVTILVGGVGLDIYAPAEICRQVRPGEQLSLYTYLVVREDALALYGFETLEARDYFVLMLGVSGIGPRLALAVLSQLHPEAIRRAVFNEQPDIFAGVPGVGRKTAQKILLHLQDRLQPGLEDLEPISALSETDSEVLAALSGLGYGVVEAQAALQSLPRDAPSDLESRLRLALQYFSR